MPAAVAIPLLYAGAAGATMGAAAINARAAGKAAKTQAEAEQANLEATERAQRMRAELMRKQAPSLSTRFAGYQDIGAQGMRNLGITPPERQPADLSGLSDEDLDRFFPTTVPKATDLDRYQQRRQQSRAGGAMGAAPQVGQTRTFPNGRVGRWDGQGWEAVR